SSPKAIEGASHANVPAPASTPRSPQGYMRRPFFPVRDGAHTGKRHHAARHRAKHSDTPRRHHRERHRRRRHRVRGTGPFLDGVAQPRPIPGEGRDYFALNAIGPHLTAAVAKDGDGGVDAALAVPALLGLAALTLAVTAVLRRRR